jgi:hypothetical protein
MVVCSRAAMCLCGGVEPLNPYGQLLFLLFNDLKFEWLRRCMIEKNLEEYYST